MFHKEGEGRLKSAIKDKNRLAEKANRFRFAEKQNSDYCVPEGCAVISF